VDLSVSEDAVFRSRGPSNEICPGSGEVCGDVAAESIICRDLCAKSAEEGMVVMIGLGMNGFENAEVSPGSGFATCGSLGSSSVSESKISTGTSDEARLLEDSVALTDEA